MVRNLYGDVVEEVLAPEDGVVLFLTSSPRWISTGFSSASALVWSRSMCRDGCGLCVVVVAAFVALSSSQM